MQAVTVLLIPVAGVLMRLVGVTPIEVHLIRVSIVDMNVVAVQFGVTMRRLITVREIAVAGMVQMLGVLVPHVITMILIGVADVGVPDILVMSITMRERKGAIRLRHRHDDRDYPPHADDVPPQEFVALLVAG